MALRTVVKIGGVTNLSDARYCAGMGVDMLGFGTVDNQADYLPVREYQEIRGWIAGPKIVAQLYGLVDPGQLADILTNYQPDLLELSPRELALFPSLPLPFILSVESASIDSNLKPTYVQGYQYEPAHTGHFLLAVSTPQDLLALDKHAGIAGIAMVGGPEIRPGLKTYDGIADVLEALEIEDV